MGCSNTKVSDSVNNGAPGPQAHGISAAAPVKNSVMEAEEKQEQEKIKVRESLEP
jgi:hypothetical protein